MATGQAIDRRPVLIAGLLAVVLLTPAVVAVAVLHGKPWYPVADLAQIELRVRDVGSSQSPLIGAPARIGSLERQGSHPGPLGFLMMWPAYRLAGASAWGMELAAASLHTAAVGVILWIAYRRGGIALMLGIGAAVAVLMRAYGPSALTQPWNPYLPLLWWVVFLLAVWSVVCADHALLPVAAFAGCFCAQTHIGYLGLTVVLGAVALGAVVVQARSRADREPGRHSLRWVLLALAVVVVTWVPPVVDERRHSPGNLALLEDHVRDPGEDRLGLRRGAEVLMVHLDASKLATTTFVGPSPPIEDVPAATVGALVPALVLLALWCLALVAAWRAGERALLRLHLVVALVLVLSLVTMAGIAGAPRVYLVFWGWGVTALVLVATGWSAAVVARRRWQGRPPRAAIRAGVVLLVGTTVVASGAFVLDAAGVEVPEPRDSATLALLVPATVEALGDDETPGGGRDGRYFLTWVDPTRVGAHGVGLVNELERHGFEVGTIEAVRAWVTPHRVMDPDTATAEVHLSVGPDIEAWRTKPGVRELVYVDPRTRDERREYQRLREQVVEELTRAGLAFLVSQLDGQLLSIALWEERVPAATREKIRRMAVLGLPAAVFVGPPGSAS